MPEKLQTLFQTRCIMYATDTAIISASETRAKSPASIFTAQCTLVQSAVLRTQCRPSVCLSVCLSVTLVDVITYRLAILETNCMHGQLAQQLRSL